MSFLLTIKPRLKAEVWLDEFKKIFYNRIPAAETVEYGDISDRVSLRQDLHCKSFKWYLDNIYPEMDFAANDDLIHSGAILIQELRVINYWTKNVPDYGSHGITVLNPVLLDK